MENLVEDGQAERAGGGGGGITPLSAGRVW